MINSIIFKQLFDQTSATFSYLLADGISRQALFIDTVYEQHERDLSLVHELDLELRACPLPGHRARHPLEIFFRLTCDW
ncbi:MAG: hypothetical protein QGG67_16240 [Gammaproteobacteria bacterium]|nr:hypothetical protein [Gammaproteobacteria bacterium]MDP6097515.1 hypothetical protein [Gammaproteobacteria bacterium]MDP7455351.1 hypothetical protein [Gammaproteobacteria bacterium]HJO12538.1 hypothetical protein [Gammaproteobacteria bacterium]